MRHVVHARAHVDDGFEGLVGGDVLDALAVDPDLAPVAQALAVVVAGTEHEILVADVGEQSKS